jgi:hypothetical protein
VEKVVAAHDHFGDGDVACVWGISRPENNVLLMITFLKPLTCELLLQFHTSSQYGLIDPIVTVQGLYIQPGRPGDILRDTLDRKRILVEVPSRNFQPHWEKLFHETLKKQLRQQGLRRNQVAEGATEWIKM